MEIVRRTIVVCIWGLASYLVIISLGAWKYIGPNDMDRVINEALPFYVIVVGGALVLHFIINWIFGGAKKKTPENRGPREPNF